MTWPRPGRPPVYEEPVLKALLRKPMRSRDVVREVTGLKKATASRLLHRFVTEGYVFADIRADGTKYFILTDKGRDLAEIKQLREFDRNQGFDRNVGFGVQHKLPHESEEEFRDRQEKLYDRLMGAFRELRDQVAKEVAIYRATRPAAIKREFERITRNRIIERIMNDAWFNPKEHTRIEYFVWYKPRGMAWKDGERLFRIHNMPAEEYEKLKSKT